MYQGKLLKACIPSYQGSSSINNICIAKIIFSKNDFCNSVAIYDDTCQRGLSLVDKCRVFNDVSHYFCLGLILPHMPLHLRLMTPKIASLKIPPDIFDVPSRRSVKIIETSSILNPSFQAVYFISIWKAYPMNLILSNPQMLMSYPASRVLTRQLIRSTRL